MIPLANCGKVKSYIGMDVNEGMLYHARKKAAAIRSNDSISTDVTTLAGSLLEELPFGDNVFDVVLINQVLRLLGVSLRLLTFVIPHVLAFPNSHILYFTSDAVRQVNDRLFISELCLEVSKSSWRFSVHIMKKNLKLTSSSEYS